MQPLERRDTSRARHHKHSSLRIALLGDLAALAALHCGRGLPAAGLRVLVPGVRQRGRGACQGLVLAVVVSWGARRVHRDSCCLRTWVGRQHPVSAPSLPRAWLKRQDTCCNPSGGRQEGQFCLQITQGSRGPCSSQAWRGVRRCCVPEVWALHRVQSFRYSWGFRETLLTVYCGTAYVLREWLVEERCVYM